MIDVGGRDTGSLRAALTVTNTLLIPVQPRSFDLWAIDNDAAAENLIETEGLEYLPIPVGRRKAFPNAAALGRSVMEQTPRDQKAVQELAALVAAVFV